MGEGGRLADDRPVGRGGAVAFAEVALEAFKEFRPVAGPDDEHVAAVVLVSFAAQIAECAKRVQGAGHDRLGNAEDLGEPADRVRARASDRRASAAPSGDWSDRAPRIGHKRSVPASRLTAIRRPLMHLSPVRSRSCAINRQATELLQASNRKERGKCAESVQLGRSARAVELLQGGESGAKAERLAALRPARLGAVAPGEGVEMRPGDARRGRSASGTWRRRSHRPSASRTNWRGRRRRFSASRHSRPTAASATPGRRVSRPAASIASRKLIVGREQRRQLGAERDPRGAGQGREIDDQLRLALRRRGSAHRRGSAGLRRRYCRSRRTGPCASVTTSPGRSASPDTAFSTAGISRCSRTGSRSAAISLASASAWAAPPMSFFISRMPLAGLRSSPPLSKQTPLPTMAMRGLRGIAPFGLDQARRAFGRGGGADRGDQREALGEASSPAVTVISNAGAAGRARPARARPGRDRAAGVLTRSRTSAVASASRTVGRSTLDASPVTSTRGPRVLGSPCRDRCRTGAGRAASRAPPCPRSPSARR